MATGFTHIDALWSVFKKVAAESDIEEILRGLSLYLSEEVVYLNDRRAGSHQPRTVEMVERMLEKLTEMRAVTEHGAAWCTGRRIRTENTTWTDLCTGCGSRVNIDRQTGELVPHITPTFEYDDRIPDEDDFIFVPGIDASKIKLETN